MENNSKKRRGFVGCVACVATISVAMAGPIVQSAEKKLHVTFSGGHETYPRDHGRPVVLVAAALNVKPEVFRKAFSGVTPGGAADQRVTSNAAIRKP